MTGKIRQKTGHKGTWLIAFLMVVLWIGCSSTPEKGDKDAARKDKMMVTVSIMPQQYFVQRIAGERVVVNVMVPSSQSPDSYEPTPRQMQELNRSQLYFRIGPLIFETVWIAGMAANNPNLKIIDTSVGTPLLHYEDKTYETGAAGAMPQHEGHEHTGIDPHTWVSPTAVKVQIGHIKDAFIQLDPVNRELYETNYTTFAREIDALHNELTGIFRDFSKRTFMVFHPAWGYFARDYNLIQLPIEVEGKTPGPATLKRVIDIARKENIRFIIVQQQSDTHNAEAVAADINGKVVALDPLELNWLENMKKIARTFKEILNDPLKE